MCANELWIHIIHATAIMKPFPVCACNYDITSCMEMHIWNHHMCAKATTNNLMHAIANMNPSHEYEIRYEFISWIQMWIRNLLMCAIENMSSSHECACKYEIISCMQMQLWNHLMNANANMKASHAYELMHAHDLPFEDGFISWFKTLLHNWGSLCECNSIYLQVEEHKGCIMNQFIDHIIW
jgi:hypothetical protein